MLQNRTLTITALCLAISLIAGAQQSQKTEEAKPATTQSMKEKVEKKPGVHDAAYTDPWVKDVKDTSYVAATGERILRHEVVVDYPLEKAWALLSTKEGLTSFMAPQFELELKTGGKWWANYSATATPTDPGWIRNTVLSYIPQQMISVKLNLLPGFPKEAVEAGTLFAVLEFQDLGNGKTRVSESLAGFGTGEGWDKVYEFFKNGNRYVFGQYLHRIKDGPVDWSKQH